MKINYFKSKFASLLLAFLIVLQSCVAYKKETSTLDEAAATNGKVLVVKTDDTKLKLTKIEQIDGVYYGSIKAKNGVEKIPLTESDLKRISVFDKTASTLGNIGIVTVTLGVLFLMTAAISLQDMD